MNNKLFELIVKSVFENDTKIINLDKGLEVLVNFYLNKLQCEVVFRERKIGGLYNEILEWIEGSVFGSKYFDTKTLKLTDYYEFFSVDDKIIGKGRLFVYASTWQVNKEHQKMWGRELVSVRDEKDGKYYYITKSGEILKAESIEDEI